MYSKSNLTASFSKAIVGILVIVFLAFIVCLARDLMSLNVRFYGFLSIPEKQNGLNKIVGIVLVNREEVYRSHTLAESTGKHSLTVPNVFGYYVSFFEETEPSEFWGSTELTQPLTLYPPNQGILQVIFFEDGTEPSCRIQLDNEKKYFCSPEQNKPAFKKVNPLSIKTTILLLFSLTIAPITGGFLFMTRKSTDGNSHRSAKRRSGSESTSLQTLIVATLSIGGLFVVVIAMLTWAASQLPLVATIAIFIVALPFLMLIFVVLLRLTGLIKGKQVMDFMYALAEHIPMLDHRLVSTLLDHLPFLAGNYSIANDDENESSNSVQ